MAAIIQLQQQFHDQRRSQPQPMDTSSSASGSEIGTPNSSTRTSVSSHSNPTSPRTVDVGSSSAASSTTQEQVHVQQQQQQPPPSHPQPPTQHFSCAYCNKSFEKKSSRNRHANNCKTKPAGERLTKQKSCVHCVKTKTRCDTLLPKCSRCRMKGLDCKYVHKSVGSAATIVGKGQAPQRHPAAATGPTNNTTTFSSEASSSSGSSNSSNMDMDMFPNGPPTLPATSLISPPMGPETFNFDWQLNSPVQHGPMLLPDLFGFPDIADAHESANRLIESASSSSRNSSISSPTAISMLCNQQQATDPNLQQQQCDQQDHQQQHIPQHPQHKGKMNPSYDYVKKIIRSYPVMMLRTSNLPPFINHYMYTSGKCGTALSNCTSIMQMNKIKTRETRELVWRVIEMECGRIMKEYTRYNDLEVLGACQAIVLYVVLWCMEEDPNIKNKFKIILYNMHEICQRLVGPGRYLCKAEIEGRRPVWEEWLFFESIRRTAALLYILDLLFDISTHLSKSRCDGLFELPLPATKNLWNASKRSDWEEEYDYMLSERRGKGMLKYGSLLVSSSVYGNSGFAQDPDLELWYANIDEYGMLVSLIIN